MSGHGCVNSGAVTCFPLRNRRRAESSDRRWSTEKANGGQHGVAVESCWSRCKVKVHSRKLRDITNTKRLALTHSSLALRARESDITSAKMEQ